MITFEKIGKYKVTQKLGQGSFGVVYQGRDAYLKRDVAIKICSVEDEGLRQRFFREAEIAGRLVHKNIVTVYEFGFEGEIPYLVQEILSGEDLSPIVKRRVPIAPATRLEYLLQVAHGLGYAHSEGVIHRDIKPGNIRVLEDGLVKIMDFGIAKLASAETQLTQKGVTMGTASYLPPEQIRGSDLDHRADIFSFGVLAYEFLTYERPFRGSTLSALVYQILYKVPQPMIEVWAECPEPLSDLISRCLDKKPERRFDSFAELIPELEAIRDDVAAGKWPALQTAPDPPALSTPTEAVDPSDVLSPTVISRTTQGVLEGKVGEYTISTVASAQEILRPPAGSGSGHSTRPISARAADGSPASASATPSSESASSSVPASPPPSPAPGGSTTADAALKTRLLDVSSLPLVSESAGENELTSAAHEISELVAQGRLEAAKEQLEATINRKDLTEISELQPPPPPPQAADKSAAREETAPPQPSPAAAQAPPPQPAPASNTAKSVASVESPDAIGSDTYRTVIRPPLNWQKWGAITGAAVIVLALGSWLAFRSSKPAEPEPVEPPPPAPVAAVATPPPSLGALTINAAPWAEITEITDGGGYLQELPEQAQTPLYLELPPNTYRIQLRDPTSEEVQTCTVDVRLEATALCAPELAETDVTEYFKSSGWWQ